MSRVSGHGGKIAAAAAAAAAALALRFGPVHLQVGSPSHDAIPENPSLDGNPKCDLTRVYIDAQVRNIIEKTTANGNLQDAPDMIEAVLKKHAKDCTPEQLAAAENAAADYYAAVLRGDVPTPIQPTTTTIQPPPEIKADIEIECVRGKVVYPELLPEGVNVPFQYQERRGCPEGPGEWTQVVLPGAHPLILEIRGVDR